jgi:hypothetical protein
MTEASEMNPPGSTRRANRNSFNCLELFHSAENISSGGAMPAALFRICTGEKRGERNEKREKSKLPNLSRFLLRSTPFYLAASHFLTSLPSLPSSGLLFTHEPFAVGPSKIALELLH